MVIRTFVIPDIALPAFCLTIALGAIGYWLTGGTEVIVLVIPRLTGEGHSIAGGTVDWTCIALEIVNIHLIWTGNAFGKRNTRCAIIRTLVA